MSQVKNKERCVFCGSSTGYSFISKLNTYVPLCSMCCRHANTNRHQFTRYFYEQNEIIRKIETIVVNEGLYIEKSDNMEDLHWCKELIVQGQLFIQDDSWMKRLPKKIFTSSDCRIQNCSDIKEMPEAISSTGIVSITDCPATTDLYDCSISAQMVYIHDCKNLKRLPKNLHADYVSLQGSTNIQYIPPNTRAKVYCGMAQVDNIPVDRLPLYLNVIAGDARDYLIERIRKNRVFNDRTT